MSEVPFNEETLVSCKDTHVLVAVFPLSILDIRTKVQGESTRLFQNQSWYNEEKIVKDPGETGWHLIRTTPVDDSTSKTWDQQQKLLRKDEETPSFRVMVYTIIGHYLVTGKRFFRRICVRCSDRDSYGVRVIVGYFVEDGLYTSNWGDNSNREIGVASARKF